MGTYNKGILGAFSGKVGPVVGANWRGKEVLRSLPRKSGKAPSQTQLLQQLKFATVTAFLNPLQSILTRYYGTNTGSKTRRNQAMSYHMKEATQYVDPNFDILYNRVQISKGDLLNVENPVATAGANSSLAFTWVDNSGQGQALATDQMVLAVYEPIGKITFTSLALADRSAEAASFPLPSYFAGLSVEVWLTVASADESRYATSVYLGTVVLV
jgi:hypothetical protein